jgi:hypothetical protein
VGPAVCDLRARRSDPISCRPDQEYWFGGTSITDADPVTVEPGESREIVITLP